MRLEEIQQESSKSDVWGRTIQPRLASQIALWNFMKERERIRDRKDRGLPYPWTQDPILQKYYISNLNGEDDKTTRWLKANWRDPYENDPDLPFAIAVFRRALNYPDTAAEVGYPVPWNPDRFLSVIASRRQRGLNIINPLAYKLLVGGVKGDHAAAVVNHVLNPLWKNRETLRVLPTDTLEGYFNRISKEKFMGGWYSYRVVCDLTVTKQLGKDRADWWTWLNLGPGTLRGLNRALGRPAETGIETRVIRADHSTGCNMTLTKAEIVERCAEVNQLRHDLGVANIVAAHVMGGALCEFDKYERIRQNPGKIMNRKYKPNSENKKR